MTPTLEFVKNEDGQWWWRVRASNGKILCHSEQYSGYGKAAHGAQVALCLSSPPKFWHAVAMQTNTLERAYNVKHLT